jgi:soluble lytic murein transglycosylase-like protein
VEHFMRVCVIAAAVIALTQPALAAKSHNKKSHRHHVSHFSHQHHAAQHHRVPARLRRAAMAAGTAAPPTFVRTDAIDRHAVGALSFPDQSWQQAWASAPAAPQAAPFGEPALRIRSARVRDSALDGMIARHAAANGLPVELVHRVVIRESRYNPRARNGGNLGLMQIKHATARGVGYAGPASGLMDAETNLTYAVRYLAGAYRAAGGNASRAVALYASGYHGRGLPRATPVAATPWPAPTTPGQR